MTPGPHESRQLRYALLALLLNLFTLGVAFGQSAQTPIAVITTVQPPYTTNEGGAPSGMFVDVLTEVTKRTGLQFSYTFLPWKRAQEIVTKGSGMLIMPLARSPEREPLYKWIVPITQFSTVLFTVNTPPASLEEAKGMHIGVMVGTTFEKEVEAAGLPNLSLVPDEITNAKKLAAGRIEGWVTTDMMAPGIFRQAGLNSDNLKRGPTLGAVKVLHISATKDFPAPTADMISTTVEMMRKEGALANIIKRYR